MTVEYFVLDENVLCFRHSDWPFQWSLSVLAASVLRGASYTYPGGSVFYPNDERRIRLATIEDFETFRVSPKGHLTEVK